MEGLLKICTCFVPGLVTFGLGWGKRGMHVKLPPLYDVSRVFAGYDDDELGDLAADHPFVKLGHDFLDVGFDLVV